MLISQQLWFNDDDAEIIIHDGDSGTISIVIQNKNDTTNRTHIVLNETMAHKLFWKLNHTLMHGEEYYGEYE